MNVACPSCQHETHLEQGIGDFPTRCTYCFNLMRLSGESSDAPRARSLRLEMAGPVRRAAKGELAALLLTRPQAVAIAVGMAAPAVALFAGDSVTQGRNPQMSVLRNALRSRENQEALGTFGWIGLGAVFVLAIIAIAMRVQSLVTVASSPHSPAQGPVAITSQAQGE